MSESNIAAAGRGVLWAVTGAALTLAGVLAFGLPRQSQSPLPQVVAPAAAPVAAPVDDKSEALRARLAALEQDVAADRKRLAEATQRTEAERQRLEEERARLSRPAPAASAPAPKPRVAAAPTPAPAKAAVAPAPKKPAVVLVARPEPPPPTPAPVLTPLPTAPAPQAAPPKPTAAETLASAERFSARGSHSEAAAMLKPLAEQDNAKAQFRLGEMYLDGRGVERNDQEGVRLVRKAASMGDCNAQLRLGEMYFRGQSVPQNNFQAYVWYNAAVRSGNAAANAPQERVAALLQPVEVEQAAKVAARLARPQQQQKGC